MRISNTEGIRFKRNLKEKITLFKYGIKSLHC